MGRWRPPPPKSSPYITPEGFETLRAEVPELWLKRRDVVKALSAAAAEGDRSENAEYIYRKKELAGIDRRIRYLQKRLPNLAIVREHPGRNQVFFGATVTVEDEAGTAEQYRIVGADETDAKKRWISIDSPMARALLKKHVDDEITVTAGGNARMLLVVDIRYGEQTDKTGE